MKPRNRYLRLQMAKYVLKEVGRKYEGLESASWLAADEYLAKVIKDELDITDLYSGKDKLKVERLYVARKN